MIIHAERMRIEEDIDNNLWLLDFRDEEKGIRGKIEIPSKLISMEEIKQFEIEILAFKENQNYEGCLIAFNARSFRTKPTGEEKTYSFSAGGLMLRLFTRKPIKEFRTALKEYTILIREIT